MGARSVVPRSYLPQRRRSWSVTQHAVNLWGRLLVTVAVIGLQLGLLAYAALYVTNLSPWFVTGNTVLMVAAVVWILNTRMPAAYKLSWVALVLVLPVAGLAFYLVFGARKVAPWTMRRWRRRAAEAAEGLRLVPSAALPADAPLDVARQVTALENTSPYVLRADTQTTYWGMGQDGFGEMLAAIGRAERYVLCEYFIVQDGQMWAALFDALRRKAAEGVEVVFLYDDIGSLFTLPPRFGPMLRAAGIKVHRVNPLGMMFSMRYNNRDHRKILAIDGTVAFTGGINIADEYVNDRVRFGTWKDSVIRLEGPGAWSLAVMTLELWGLVSGHDIDFAAYAPPSCPTRPEAGWCLPYADSPYRETSLSELTYRNQIMRANHTVDIFTPYLILDEEMNSLLQTVATSGVRVRIVVPGIPDKPYVYAVTRSFYASLVAAGVEIHEYSPGFIHAKVCLVDDEVAVVGSVNFDYRSFFLQQEDAVWLYCTEAVGQVVDDVAATIPQCRRVTADDIAATPAWKRVWRRVLRLFAPLM